MAGDSVPPSAYSIENLIAALERRAIVRRREAYFVLAIMLSILVSAAIVFANARDITVRDTNVDASSIGDAVRAIKSKIVQLSDPQEPDQFSLQELNYSLAYSIGSPSKELGYLSPLQLLGEDGRLVKKQNIIDVVKHDLDEKEKRDLDEKTRESARNKDPQQAQPNVTTDAGAFVSYSAILLPDDVNPQDSSETLKGVSVPIRVSRKDLEAFERNSWHGWDYDILGEGDMVKEISRHYLSGMSKASLSGLIEQIDKISRSVRPTEKNDSDRSYLGFILQLNITRFGTITIAAVAIGLLAPLYKYSIRLSAFYQGRTDALRLHQLAYKRAAFPGLATALTPGFDFHKSGVSEKELLDSARFTEDSEKETGKDVG